MELKYKHIFVLIALSLGGMSTWGQPKVTYRQIVTSPIDSWVEVTDRTKAMNGETQGRQSKDSGHVLMNWAGCHLDCCLPLTASQ